jgi:hypothetical protein
LGQTYEKLLEKGQARQFYRKAAAAVAHNPAAGYAVPLSKKRLGALGT